MLRYNKQKELLMQYYQDNAFFRSSVDHIGTVDSAQGDEADFIIIT